MRFSKMFVSTLREAPAGTETASAVLLTRAGFQRQLGAGIYSLLPFGTRTAAKIEQILREEMEAIDCYEVVMPTIQPADLIKESGRWDEYGKDMARFKDRYGRDMIISPTHEEVATDLVRRSVRSYRQLPVSFFHIQNKFRDEPRPRAGLLRGREFKMKDAYSFHTDLEDFQRGYLDFYRAYLRIFARMGLPVMVVEASGGVMGGEISHEFTLEAEAGEDALLFSPNGNYAVNSEIARTRLDIPDEEPLPVEEVETPNASTIEDVANYLGVGKDRTLKAMFYEVRGDLVFVVIRGDLDVSAAKLGAVLSEDDLKPASAEMIRAAGAVPGYASPVGLKDVYIVADESARTPNLVAGANREGYHLKNVNLGRDYQPDLVVDIMQVRAGMPSPVDGAPLSETRGIEVGNIFSLGTKYSKPLRAVYLDDQDREHEMIMGSYGIGVGRTMAAIAEHFRDDAGLIWPVSVAPFHVHLITLGSDDEAIKQAEDLYAELEASGIETLFDDREESAGVKFNDADLIGIPFRVTVSPRSLQAGGAEIKRRDLPRETTVTLPVSEVYNYIFGQLAEMQKNLMDAAQREEARTPEATTV